MIWVPHPLPLKLVVAISIYYTHCTPFLFQLFSIYCSTVLGKDWWKIFWSLFLGQTIPCWESPVDTHQSNVHSYHGRNRPFAEKRLAGCWGVICEPKQRGRECVDQRGLYTIEIQPAERFHRTLSIRGNELNADWAYAEMISSHPEQTRKCFKVEYLGWNRIRPLGP